MENLESVERLCLFGSGAHGLQVASGVLDLTLHRLRGLRHFDCADLCHTVQGCVDDLGHEYDDLEVLLRENREAEGFAHDKLLRR